MRKYLKCITKESPSKLYYTWSTICIVLHMNYSLYFTTQKAPFVLYYTRSTMCIVLHKKHPLYWTTQEAPFVLYYAWSTMCIVLHMKLHVYCINKLRYVSDVEGIDTRRSIRVILLQYAHRLAPSNNLHITFRMSK